MPFTRVKSAESPKDLAARYELDPSITSDPIGSIAIVDDVLTTGAHFKAAQAVLSRAFPDSGIVGLFIARRVPNTTDV